MNTDVLVLGNPGAAGGVVIEVPHGAAGDWEYQAVAATLKSPLPPGLIGFFHVNTDAGAAELALATGRMLIALGVERVVVVRCRIPRTFIDTNRVLGGSDQDYRAGGVTPGVPPWIVHPDDHTSLRARYVDYQTVASQHINDVCHSGGRALLLHTYAPRSVDVEVGPDIVPSLTSAWATPEQWPLRPELDLIHRDPYGKSSHSAAGVALLRAALNPLGLTLAEGETYPLHPVTTAFGHVARFPGQVACLEVRRDLLTAQFTPMLQVQLDTDRIARIAGALSVWMAGDW